VRKRLGNTALTVVACVATLAQASITSADAMANGLSPVAAPDLSISQFSFVGTKSIRVHVVNAGGTASPPCILRLTLRKINGVPAGRVTEIKLPPLAPGKDKWLVLNANSILPNNVALATTTFKLNADATSIVPESDESNNEVWHNLSVPTSKNRNQAAP
jgi:hypothetical protein